jgi:SAM-dependent methyltransferase
MDGLAAMTVEGRSPGKSIPLPPRRLRSGGEHYRGDTEFVSSGRDEARSLAQEGFLTPTASMLDFGCGVGRLAVGLLEDDFPLRHYVGIDVRRPVIRWARRHIARFDSRFSFLHVNIENQRYNPRGRAFQQQRLPLGADTFDIGYSYSVFSHLNAQDSRSAFRELRRLLLTGSFLVLTAFVEDDVRGVVVNPTGYGRVHWRGPLHCVLYQRSIFEGLAKDEGFQVLRMTYGGETEGQSRYVFVAV